MKLKIVSMLVILAILIVMPILYMGKFDSSTWVSADDELDFDLSRFVSSVFKKGSGVVIDKEVKVYKWRDQEGVMQFSSELPPDIHDAEQIVLHPDSNVVQAIKATENEGPPSVAKAEIATTPYSDKGMKKIMGDAKGIEDVLQQRDAEQQRMLNGI